MSTIYPRNLIANDTWNNGLTQKLNCVPRKSPWGSGHCYYCILNSKLDIYMFITVGWLSLVQWPTIQSNMILCPSALGMAQLWCKDIIFRQMYLLYIKLLTTSQGCHSWQGPQGLGLTWILQNRKWRWKWTHAADVATTVAALSAKNWPWRPASIGSIQAKPLCSCHSTTTSTF